MNLSIRTDSKEKRMKVETLHSIYQIRIQLRGIKPGIWRRLLVRNSSSLAELHDVIQIAMGWQDCHIHQFVKDRVCYGLSEGMQNELDYRVSQLLKEKGDKLLYEYDFGDGWQHDVVLEKILPFKQGQTLPVCLAGERACPLEDIGGIPGYEMCLHALANSDDPTYEAYLEFTVEDFDADYFSVECVNEDLEAYRCPEPNKPEA